MTDVYELSYNSLKTTQRLVEFLHLKLWLIFVPDILKYMRHVNVICFSKVVSLPVTGGSGRPADAAEEVDVVSEG